MKRRFAVWLLLCVTSLFVRPVFASPKKFDHQLYDELTSAAVHMQGPWVNPRKRHESKTHRQERIKIITKAIVLELPNAKGLRGEEWFWKRDVLAWATFTKMWWESGRFSLAVHSGRKRGDHGKSVCLGQIMHGGESLVGTDLKHTRNCVRRVMAFLIMHQNGCLSHSAKVTAYTMAMIYAAYGTGRTCNPNHWMKIYKKGGGYVRNADGSFKRNYWARKRGWMFWQLYTGRHPSQRLAHHEEKED